MKSFRNIYIVASAIVALSLCISCEKEDPIVPLNEGFANYFAPLAGANDPESNLRREYYDQTSCYLLFNDTLVTKQVGTDKDGDPLYFHETVNLSYGITSTMSTKYAFNYFSNMEDKTRAAKMIQDELLAKMSEKQRPFSVLLTDVITANSLYDYGWEDESVNFVSNLRCTAIAINDIANKTDEELAEVGKALLNKFIASSLEANMNSAVFKPFFSFGEGQYDMSYDLEEGDHPEITDGRELGFLSADIDLEWSYMKFPSKHQDLQDFTNAVLTITYEDFKAKHADYSLVLEKYVILKQIIKDLGYKIN